MTHSIQTRSVHHVALTVSQVRRSVDFYTSLLGFQVAMEFGPRVLLHNGSMVLAITPPSDPAQAAAEDCFNENRIGLDHLSFSVASKDELDQAATILKEHGIPHGEIKDLGNDLRIYVLALRDPDNIQVELTAPYA
jgi:catechol 2,3-dioxygenase-like lactoylglutathione lyase family enzyme